jgi:Uma2 family endonuclease
MSTPAYQLKMSDEVFYALVEQNRDLRLERTAKGELIIMPPTGGETGSRNDEITRQLSNWRKNDGRVRLLWLEARVADRS